MIENLFDKNHIQIQKLLTLNIFLPFIFGFSTSFVGMIFPGMLNMTTVKISIERGNINAYKFAFGVSIIVLIQAYTAIFFIKQLNENSEFIQIIQKIAMFIFLLLSVYFYREYKKTKRNISTFKQQCKNTFLIGLLLSALNMFAIPFYYGITILLNNFGWLKLSPNNILLFVVGSAIGSFILLYLYPNLIKLLPVNSTKSSNKMNLVLSVLTGVLALVTLIILY